MTKINRRQALTRLAGLVAAGAAGSARVLSAAATTGTAEASPTAATSGASGSVTVAHITDIHLLPHDDAEKWFAKCLHHIQSNQAKPQFIINTGDCVMDTLSQSRSEADALWKIWKDSLQQDNSLPMKQCLGNHDHWGLALTDPGQAKLDPQFGKKLALDNLELSRSYYSFDLGAWHAIILDSILPADGQPGDGWIAALGDEQFEWLENDLKATPKEKPVVVFSHVPIVQACSFINLGPDEHQSYFFHARKMHSDLNRILPLFAGHPNVKLCLSGHLHMRDRVELDGVTYICDGAVCGNWWKGPRFAAPPGYSTLTLNPDGTFAHNFQPYGWDGVVKA